MFSSSYVWLGFYYYCTDSNFHQYTNICLFNPIKPTVYHIEYTNMSHESLMHHDIQPKTR